MSNPSSSSSSTSLETNQQNHQDPSLLDDWQTDACIHSVNLRHNVQFVSPMYLSRVSKQHSHHQNNNNNPQQQPQPSTEQKNQIQEQSGVLFLSGPDSEKRLHQREIEQEQRFAKKHGYSPSSRLHHHSKWALERVIAMPPTTNASDWLGDMNRCIIRLNQSMKRSVVPKLRETVSLHSSVAVLPLEKAASSGNDEGENERNNNNNNNNNDSGMEFLVLREALHHPRSKKLRKFFDKIPSSSISFL